MQPIERQSAVQHTAERVKEYIMDDAHQVGEKLPTERWFCEQLNISRSTLREAIRLLQADGYTEMRPGMGAYIASKDGRGSRDAAAWLSENKASLHDLFEVRQAIEELAVRLAIERATEEDIRTLHAIHGSYLDAVECNDVEKIVLLDAEYHNFIATATRNTLLISINESISARVMNFRRKTFQLPRNVRNSLEPHISILNAFDRRDPAMGLQAMHLHFMRMFEDLEQSRSDGYGE